MPLLQPLNRNRLSDDPGGKRSWVIPTVKLGVSFLLIATSSFKLRLQSVGLQSVIATLLLSRLMKKTTASWRSEDRLLHASPSVPP
jgi:hypothetical protein